jgi:Tfp pilus assembly protein PilO
MQQLLATEIKIEEKQELVNKVNNALPLGPDIPSLLNFLQETSTETGMSLEGASWQELSLSGKKNKERFKEYSLNLQLSGSYFAFINFLYSLEKSSRLINVVESDFSIPLEENEPIPFDVLLKVYSY